MWRALIVYCVSQVCAVGALRLLGSSILGQDPQTVNRLNGESFQQDALVTFKGVPYIKFMRPYILIFSWVCVSVCFRLSVRGLLDAR